MALETSLGISIKQQPDIYIPPSLASYFTHPINTSFLGGRISPSILHAKYLPNLSYKQVLPT